MNLSQAIVAFVHDLKLQSVVVLIFADIVFGMLAAALDKTQKFSLLRITDFLRDDVAGKVLPWFALYAFAKLSPGADVLGVDFNAIQDVVYAGVVVALIASLTTSLSDLGFKPIDKVPLLGRNAGSDTSG